MKIGMISGTFRPINKLQVKYGLDLIKKENLDFLFFQSNDYTELIMLDIALKPYKKMGYTNNFKTNYFYKMPQELNSNIEKGDFRNIDKEVIKYIFENNIFIEEILRNILSDHRFKHSLSVAKVCTNLAKIHNVNINDAYLCGMLHDITKEMDKESSKNIMSHYYPEYLNLNYKVYHQYTGVIFIKHYMKFFNSDILNAIENHVGGTSNSKLAKILYIADKIDPSRGYNVDFEMSLCKRDLNKGFKYIKESQKRYLKEKEGIDVK